MNGAVLPQPKRTRTQPPGFSEGFFNKGKSVRSHVYLACLSAPCWFKECSAPLEPRAVQN